MASSTYYNKQAHMLYDHDQQHLLSPSMSSPGFSSGHPSSLKPLHILSHGQSTGYQPTPTFEDFETLKEASYEDAVCSLTTLLHNLLNRAGTQSTHSSPPSRLPRPLFSHLSRSPRPHHHDISQVHQHERHLPYRSPSERAHHSTHCMGKRHPRLADMDVLRRRRRISHTQLRHRLFLQVWRRQGECSELCDLGV
jgi:hypothetical protein